LNALWLASRGALCVGVSETSPGLFVWDVSQLSVDEGLLKRIGSSDHPYPTHDGAMTVGTACLKAYEAEAKSFYDTQLASDML